MVNLKMKLPFFCMLKLEILSAIRHFIPVFPGQDQFPRLVRTDESRKALIEITGDP